MERQNIVDEKQGYLNAGGVRARAEDYIDQFNQMNEYAQHYIYGFICGYNAAYGERERELHKNDTGI